MGVEGEEDDYSFQWYSNTGDSSEGGTPVEGATGPSYKPPTDEPDTTYYYVVIKNKRNGKTTMSDPMKVTVKEVSSIAVTSSPAKTVYVAGETLDLSGLVVTATYSDGSIAAVTGYTASNLDSSTTGEKTITVTYGGKTASFTVNITLVEMVSISSGTFTMSSPDGESERNGNET